MRLLQTIVLSGLGAAVTLNIGGCPLAANRTNNQGGGTVVTGAAKIAGGQLSGLTADEVQLLTDAVIDLADRPELEPITDEEAGAAIDFIQQNNLNTLDDVRQLVEQAAENPDSVIIPESIERLIEAGDIPLVNEEQIQAVVGERRR